MKKIKRIYIIFKIDKHSKSKTLFMNKVNNLKQCEVKFDFITIRMIKDEIFLDSKCTITRRFIILKKIA